MVAPERVAFVQVWGECPQEFQEILTPEALDFVGMLHRKFNPRREELLERRIKRQVELDNGKLPTFLPETEHIRQGQWQVAPTPPDLQNRRVEITGPVDRKMMINALNSGASVFMADFEDSLSPNWFNVIRGQINLKDAVCRALEFTRPDGKVYELNEEIAVLMVRPRGWHLTEKNVLVDSEQISASLFDFGLYFFHNAHELIQHGTGPYFYLPKLESHLEARLWNEVFSFAEEELGIPYGTIRATVLIETILAAYEMEEILYELRDHAAGLNAGRWDYIFSVIKKFRNHTELTLPDRGQITMTVPFMRAYTELLVQTCHKRGAHAMGGMAAFIPNRRDLEVTEKALQKVREDKERECNDGFDGTWVAHPDLVPVAMEIFDRELGSKANQKNRLREDVKVTTEMLRDIRVPNSKITEDGVRLNIGVAMEYLDAWLGGNGAAAINNLMEDMATAEISRSQLWQWLQNSAVLDTGAKFDRHLYERICQEELAELKQQYSNSHFDQARQILDVLVLSSKFTEFITYEAYRHLH